MWTEQEVSELAADPQLLSLFDVASFAAAVLSLGLGILAIWLSLKFKADGDAVNRDTRGLLTEIRAETKLMSQLGMKELAEYGRMSRDIVSASSTIMVGQAFPEEPPVDPAQDPEPQNEVAKEPNGLDDAGAQGPPDLPPE